MSLVRSAQEKREHQPDHAEVGDGFTSSQT